jgi:hypothetical protein
MAVAITIAIAAHCQHLFGKFAWNFLEMVVLPIEEANA